jgi:DNA-binding MarR family transcriptional regulator
LQARHLTQATLAIFRANGQLIEWGDRFVAPLGLTSARWQMLGAIGLSDRPLSAPQLGVAMGVTRQGAQKQLNLLLSGGLVKQIPNPHHQRSPHYQLTETGRQLFGRIDSMWIQAAEKIASDLAPHDMVAVCRALDALCGLLAGKAEGEGP